MKIEHETIVLSLNTDIAVIARNSPVGIVYSTVECGAGDLHLLPAGNPDLRVETGNGLRFRRDGSWAFANRRTRGNRPATTTAKDLTQDADSGFTSQVTNEQRNLLLTMGRQ